MDLQAASTAQDPELIARLQTAAARSPAFYRARLMLLAVAGDVTLSAVRVVPWFAVIFFGVVLANRVFFYWMGAAALVFLVWLLRPGFRLEGRPLRSDEAPALFREIEALRSELDVRGRMDVLLDDSFNAGAAESRGFFGLAATRRVLVIGVPVLTVLGVEQFRAVLAHEFGHFSRRHGRLGHWLYRARVGWMLFAAQVEESDSPFDRAAAWYAKRFVPYFSTRSFVHARQCEYEADADAASVVGTKGFSEALTRVAVLTRLWDEELPRRVKAWQREAGEPPSDFHERFRALEKDCPRVQQEALCAAALAEASGWSDTHPSLADRLQSVGEEARLVGIDVSAGSVLLGEAWPRVLEEFNSEWTKRGSADWLIEHLRFKHIVQPLVAVDRSAVQTWEVAEQLTRARALRVFDPEEGLSELASLHFRYSQHPHISFAYGAALLRENDEKGVELMRTLAKESPLFRMQAYLRLLGYFVRRGDAEKAERFSDLARRIAQRERAATSPLLSDAEEGRADVSSLPREEKAFVTEATARDPCVANAWLFQGTVQLAAADYKTFTPVVTHGLALAIDPDAAKRAEQDESVLAERYEALLGSLVPADQISVVRTFFTTEKLSTASWESRHEWLLSKA
jgi:Zn-dependent protease with chaperone function